MLKERLWCVFYLILMLTCFLVCFGYAHYYFGKRTTKAKIIETEKVKTYEYKVKIAFVDDEKNENNVYLRLEYPQFNTIKDKSSIPIYYSSLINNQVYIVDFAPSFIGRSILFLVLACLFFIGFYTSKENLKDGKP